MRLILVAALLCVSVSTAGAESGLASIYANGDGHAWTRTANGERVDPRELTAAHKTLPFGTKVLVINLATGKSVVVRINDRGPFKRGRIIDLTPSGAKQLGFRDGLIRVRIGAL